MSALTGTATLTKVALRRSRLMIIGWVVSLATMAAVSAAATVDLYPDVTQRILAAESVNKSSALVAMYGRIYDPTSIGALSVFKLIGLGSVFVAVLGILVATRHTRTDEEQGRLELLGGTPMARLAPLAAALTVLTVTALALGIATAGALVIAGLPVSGSIAFGVLWMCVLLVFGALATLVGQFTTSSRTANSASITILAALYALRAFADATGADGPHWLSWLSPFGVALEIRPFAGDRWWPAAILIVAMGGCAAGAVAIAARRDIGTGLIAARRGPASAHSRLLSPLGLAWRLDRAAFLGWGLGFLLLGAMLGSIASSVGDFMTSDQARDFIMTLGGQQQLDDAFLALEFRFGGVFAAAYGITIVGRLASEERDQRAQPILAAAVSRIRWAGSHLTIAFATVAAVLALMGLGAGVGYALSIGDLGQIPRITVAALSQTPAAWVVVAIASTLFGLGTRLIAVAWVAFGAFLLISELGTLLDLSHWAMDVSPFVHAPMLPGGSFPLLSSAVLVLVTAALLVLGLAALDRRDIG